LLLLFLWFLWFLALLLFCCVFVGRGDFEIIDYLLISKFCISLFLQVIKLLICHRAYLFFWKIWKNACVARIVSGMFNIVSVTKINWWRKEPLICSSCDVKT
jgi:hypothetical protein